MRRARRTSSYDSAYSSKSWERVQAELRPKLQMVAFEVVKLHSSALRDKKIESGGLHNVAGKRAYDAADQRNYSNVFQYFWLTAG